MVGGAERARAQGLACWHWPEPLEWRHEQGFSWCTSWAPGPAYARGRPRQRRGARGFGGPGCQVAAARAAPCTRRAALYVSQEAIPWPQASRGRQKAQASGRRHPRPQRTQSLSTNPTGSHGQAETAGAPALGRPIVCVGDLTNSSFVLEGAVGGERLPDCRLTRLLFCSFAHVHAIFGRGTLALSSHTCEEPRASPCRAANRTLRAQPTHRPRHHGRRQR
jgi:hypothetical protein